MRHHIPEDCLQHLKVLPFFKCSVPGKKICPRVSGIMHLTMNIMVNKLNQNIIGNPQ